VEPDPGAYTFRAKKIVRNKDRNTLPMVQLKRSRTITEPIFHRLDKPETWIAIHGFLVSFAWEMFQMPF